MSIANEKYVSLTTYKKDGTPKALPVWIAPLGDGRVGFTTSGESWKAKRLRNDPRVELQPSDSRGRITEGSEPVTGTGKVMTGAEFERVQAAIKSKYGLAVTAIGVMSRLASLLGKRKASDSAIVIELD